MNRKRAPGPTHPQNRPTVSDFTLNILGCGSAVPTSRHNPACQVVDHRDTLYMIDCGEGAQTMFRRMRLRINRLRHIFIGHLHGDHLFGLPGLLSTLALNEANGVITVHIMEQGAEAVRKMLELSSHDLPYTIEWNILDPRGGQMLIDTPSLTVRSFRLYHGVPCVGFRFDEKPKPRHLRGDMLQFYNVPVKDRVALKQGADLTLPDGRVIPNERLTSPADPSGSYAYASDTAYSPHVAEAVRGVGVLYHEATYADSLAQQARRRGHSTAREAALTAREAGVGELVIGHYSKRYLSTDILVGEARSVFPRVIAADEGMKIDLLTGDVL